MRWLWRPLASGRANNAAMARERSSSHWVKRLELLTTKLQS